MLRSFVRREQSVIALRLRHRLRRAADNQIEGCEVINGHRLKLPLVTTRQSGTGISALFPYEVDLHAAAVGVPLSLTLQVASGTACRPHRHADRKLSRSQAAQMLCAELSQLTAAPSLSEPVAFGSS
jgi:hypothetical protein